MQTGECSDFKWNYCSARQLLQLLVLVTRDRFLKKNRTKLVISTIKLSDSVSKLFQFICFLMLQNECGKITKWFSFSFFLIKFMRSDIAWYHSKLSNLFPCGLSVDNKPRSCKCHASLVNHCFAVSHNISHFLEMIACLSWECLMPKATSEFIKAIAAVYPKLAKSETYALSGTLLISSVFPHSMRRHFLSN